MAAFSTVGGYTPQLVTKDTQTTGSVSYFDPQTGNIANTTADLLTIILIELRSIRQVLEMGLNVPEDQSLRSDPNLDLTVVQTPPTFS